MLSVLPKVRILAVVIVTAAASPAAAQQPSIGGHWSTIVEFARGQNGRRITMVCPPGGSAANVWGDQYYTDDSSVCTAAVHAGVIDFVSGGAVTVTIHPGRGRYASTLRNGVQSSEYGTHTGSFTVGKATDDGQVDWTTTAKGFAASSAKQITVVCPPGGEAGEVWGSEVYTDDSSICTAAVHAGAITFEAGGRVTLKSAGEQRAFAASMQRGVTSQSYNAYPSSFSIGGRMETVAAPRATKAVESKVAHAPVSERRRDAAADSVATKPSSQPAAPVSVTRVITTDPLKIVGTVSGSLRQFTTPALNLTANHAQPRLVIITTQVLNIVGVTP